MCAVGIVGNTLSLTVFLQRNNCRLTGVVYIAALAVADLGLVASALMMWSMGKFFTDNCHFYTCKVAMFMGNASMSFFVLFHYLALTKIWSSVLDSLDIVSTGTLSVQFSEFFFLIVITC